MKCENHNNNEANFICLDCGSKICNDCAVNNNGKIVCIKCAEKRELPIIKNNIITVEDKEKNNNNGGSRVENSKRKISSFWATILALMPGAGHMYLGVMKRGLQIMLAFFGIIAIGNLFYDADFLVFFAIIIWFYGFFDCYHIRKKLQNGEEVVEDLIIDIDMKKINFHYVGIGLVIFGALILINGTFTRFEYSLSRYSIYPEVFRFIRNATFPVFLIIGGILILRNSKKNLVD